MSKPKEESLDHVLVVRGGSQHQFTGKGKGGATLLLLEGVPEPIEHFLNAETAQAFLDDGVVVKCNKNGTLEDGKKHPSMESVDDQAPKPTLASLAGLGLPEAPDAPIVVPVMPSVPLGEPTPPEIVQGG